MLGQGSPQSQVQGKLILDGQRFWIVKPNLKRGYRHDKSKMTHGSLDLSTLRKCRTNLMHAAIICPVVEVWRLEGGVPPNIGCVTTGTQYCERWALSHAP